MCKLPCELEVTRRIILCGGHLNHPGALIRTPTQFSFTTWRRKQCWRYKLEHKSLVVIGIASDRPVAPRFLDRILGRRFKPIVPEAVLKE